MLARKFEPELIVGVSIGALNGYLIACGVGPEELVGMWRDPSFRRLDDLHGMLQRVTSRYTPRIPLAVAVTDILTLRARAYRDGAITWRHLAASCAVPPVYAPVRVDGRWYTDGGVRDPLPLWLAVELGATEIEGLQVMGKFPSPVLSPFVTGFRRMIGGGGTIPQTVKVRVWEPSERLGGLKDSLWGSQRAVERWIELGARDVEKHFPNELF